MTVTAAQIAQVRRMTAEPTATTYTDAIITAYIEAYPLTDENGEPPRVDSDTEPGLSMVNPDWTDTYDLHAAAGDIWDEKASAMAENFDMNADGASLSRSQAYSQAMQQARYHRSRRSPRTIILIPNVSRERTGDVL